MKKLLTFALLLQLTGCGQPTENKPASPPEAGYTVTQPNDVKIQLLDFEGIEKLVASKKGQVVVMDAWSTSCPPCLKEFPNLVALHKKHRKDGVACISLSFDYEGIGSPEKVKPQVEEFLVSQGAVFDNVLSAEESDALYRKFKLASVPAVFVYDREGKLVKRFDNENAATEADAFTYEQVIQLVQELLAK